MAETVTNVAVAQLLGCRVIFNPLGAAFCGCEGGPHSERPGEAMRGYLADYLHDDALAWRSIVPALRQRGFFVAVHQSPVAPHHWFCDAETLDTIRDASVPDGPHALARVLCAVAIAALGGSDGR